MIKNKKHINNNYENENVEELEDISIEEIDKEIEDFHIDKERMENIKYSFDKDTLIKDAINKAEKEIKKDKLIKNFTKVAAILLVITSIGLYSPALAYFSPTLMKTLQHINNVLKIDEITSYMHLDKLIPKAKLNEKNEIKFVKVTSYKVIGSDEKIETEEATQSNEIKDEYEVVLFIHRMSNEIINAKDGRKFGGVEITPKNIDRALSSVKNINNEEARSYLYGELKKWKNGNFENGVEVHNYVWHMLDGNVGIASSLDMYMINKIKNKYFK